jgi:hypothetical protein
MYRNPYSGSNLTWPINNGGLCSCKDAFVRVVGSQMDLCSLRARARGSSRLVRIYIQSLPRPLEIDDHQKIRNWKKVRCELQADSAQLCALAEKIDHESQPGVRPEFPGAAPAGRVVLPSIFPLLCGTGEISMPFLTGEQPSALAFPVSLTVPCPSLPQLPRLTDHPAEAHSPQLPQ